MKREIKVQLTLSEGYRERFTKACIRVAKKRAEGNQKAIRQEEAKTAEAV